MVTQSCPGIAIVSMQITRDGMNEAEKTVDPALLYHEKREGKSPKLPNAVKHQHEQQLFEFWFLPNDVKI